MVQDEIEEDYVLVNVNASEDDEVAAIVEGWAGRPKDYWKEEGASGCQGALCSVQPGLDVQWGCHR